MSDFTRFLDELASVLGIGPLSQQIHAGDEHELAAGVLARINAFLYQQKTAIPSEYISEFHRYWKENHRAVLSPRIDGHGQCLQVAKVLEDIYGHQSFKVQLDTLGLSKQEVANVRFFTAIQDFNVDVHAKGNPFEFYKRHPDCYDPSKVRRNPLLVDQLLNFLQAESQRDKRKRWMANAARLLEEGYQGSAYRINEAHGRDVLHIIEVLTSEERYGFSTKKAHMFLRDMADLGVWEYESNVDKLDVMSDKNTMRVALRTGILQFRIPLLASYLDVYGYQYSLVDECARLGWREVWEAWETLPGSHRPPTPASMDYLIYRLGKIACHRNRRACPPGKAVSAKRLESLMPQDRLVFTSDRYCIFSGLCAAEHKILNAPNSISIQGRTGWKSGKTNEGGGGGISS